MLVIKQVTFECNDPILLKLENGQLLIGLYIDKNNNELIISNIKIVQFPGSTHYVLVDYSIHSDPGSPISINNSLVVAKAKPCKELAEVYKKYLEQ